MVFHFDTQYKKHVIIMRRGKFSIFSTRNNSIINNTLKVEKNTVAFPSLLNFSYY